MRNIPITVLTFLIVISFFVIVVVPYHSSVYRFRYPFQSGSKLTKNTNLLIIKITCQKH